MHAYCLDFRTCRNHANICTPSLFCFSLCDTISLFIRAIKKCAITQILCRVYDHKFKNLHILPKIHAKSNYSKLTCKTNMKTK